MARGMIKFSETAAVDFCAGLQPQRSVMRFHIFEVNQMASNEMAARARIQLFFSTSSILWVRLMGNSGIRGTMRRSSTSSMLLANRFPILMAREAPGIRTIGYGRVEVCADITDCDGERILL